MINFDDFKESLARFCGRDWVQLQNSKFSIPCPGDHQSTSDFGHYNIIFAFATEFGQCDWCGLKFNSAEKLIAALEAKYKAQLAKRPAVEANGDINSSPISEKDSTNSKESFEEFKKRHRHPLPHSEDFATKIMSVGDILSQEFGDVAWLIERMIPAPGIMALSGMPGDFKSFITLHMALSVARGTPVFGKFAVQKGAVLIIDEENHLRYVKKRLQLLGATGDDAIYYLSLSGFKVDDEDMVVDVLRTVQEKNIILIVLDSFVDIHDQEENDAGGTSKVFRGIKQFLAINVSVISIHHHRKGNRLVPNSPAQNLRGSSNILAEVDSHISVERKQDDDVLILRHNKSRHAEALTPIEIRVIKNDADPREPVGFEFVGTLDEKKKKAEEAAEEIEVFLQEGIKSRQDIEATLSDKVGKGAASDGLKLLEKGERIRRVSKKDLPEELKKESRKHFYQLVSQSEGDDDELPML